jgi:hypothetical protein
MPQWLPAGAGITPQQEAQGNFPAYDCGIWFDVPGPVLWRFKTDCCAWETPCLWLWDTRRLRWEQSLFANLRRG